MKKIFLFLCFSFICFSLSAQQFSNQSDVGSYLNGKVFIAKFENGNSAKMTFDFFGYYIKLYLNDNRFFSTSDLSEDILMVSNTQAVLKFYETKNPDNVIRLIVNCHANQIVERSSGIVFSLVLKEDLY